MHILDGKSVCMPAPDSIYPYKKRLNFLKKGTIVQLNKKCNIDLCDVRLTSTGIPIGFPHRWNQIRANTGFF